MQDNEAKKIVMTHDELVELIDQALSWFGHSECPYCERGIGLDKYVTMGDIEEWLEEMDDGNDRRRI